MGSLLPVLRNTRVELMSIGREEARETDPSQRSSWAVDLFKEGLAAISDEEAGEPGPVRTLVFVTTRYVEDEELFLNYRLNPTNAPPPWYVPVDPDEDARRWT